jgi:hypothetical protein
LAVTKEGQVYATNVDEKSPLQSPAILRCATEAIPSDAAHDCPEPRAEGTPPVPPAPLKPGQEPPPPPQAIVHLDFVKVTVVLRAVGLEADVLVLVQVETTPHARTTPMTLPMFAHLLGCTGPGGSSAAARAREVRAPRSTRCPARRLIRQVSPPDGKTWLEDPVGRARFYEENGKIKLKYNTRLGLEHVTRTLRERSRASCSVRRTTSICSSGARRSSRTPGSCSPADLADRTGASIAGRHEAQQALQT